MNTIRDSSAAKPGPNALRSCRSWLLSRSVRRALLTVAGLLAILLITWWLCPKPALYPPGFEFSRVMLDRDGKVIHLALTHDAKYRLHTPLPAISKDMQRATLELEDRRFFDHPGVNVSSLARAIWGVASGSKLGGGSTITMQLARMRFGLQTRSPVGKATQVLRAMQLERHYSKQELLEAYFNIAPYGANVEGVGAASLLWCGKQADELNLRDAVALSVLPQSPTKRAPRASSKPSDATARLWDRLGARDDVLNKSYVLRPEQCVPREAPHLARRLMGSAPLVRSTIDSEKQKMVAECLAQFIERRKDRGIVNGCALLVDAPTREVLAYAGSAAFLNDGIQGQVDGVTARRSPGSCLKPFIYALAMDQGLIHPRSLVRDGRLDFVDYSPENFDREFTGPITAAEALQRSRNIPAISLLQHLARPGFYGFLKSTGVKLPKEENWYGLSLALGGEEVSVEEVARLYAMLADDGVARPLVFERGRPVRVEGKSPALSAPARFLTLDMLRANGSEIAMKTGTSHGFRDAWCAGVSGRTVLVVWLGNFDGRGCPSLVARETAAPLCQQIFERLQLPKQKIKTPDGVTRVELCAVSGELPGSCCDHRIQGWFIPGVSPIRTCDIHRAVLVDAATGLRVARDDGTHAIRREVCEFWPPDLLEMFKAAGLPRKPLPAWASGEATSGASTEDRAPRIVSPIAKRIYNTSGMDAMRQSIPLRADASPGVKQIFWFAGTRFLGASEPARALMWKAAAGRWKLQALDDHGRSTACEVVVE